MEKNPADYPWSSHRAYLGKETIPWLTTETVLTEFGSNMSKARLLFDTFLNERINEGYREEFHTGGKGVMAGYSAKIPLWRVSCSRLKASR